MGLMNLYSMMIANWLNGGRFSQRRQRMSPSDIVTEYDIIFTKNYAKKCFRIVGIKPDNIDMAFIDYVRDRMFEMHPTVEVVISLNNYPTKVGVNDDKFSRAMSRASNSYTTYREAFESQGGLARLTGKTYRLPGGGRIRLSKERMDSLRQVFLSYYYLYDYISAGGTVCLTDVFVELVSKDVRELQLAEQSLMGILGQVDIGVEKVKTGLKTYMNQMCPAVPPPTKLHKKFVPQLLFTDENSAAFSSYKARGIVGGKGILMGLDFRSRLPLSLPLFSTSAAENILLLGKSGSGKSYAAFQFVLSGLAVGCHAAVVDIKGKEWIALSAATGGIKTLSFDDSSSSYVNMLRISDADFSLENPEDVLNRAISGTVSLLKIVVNLQPGEGNPADLESVLREAVSKLFSQRRVTAENPESFKNTDSLRYSDVLPVLESLLTTASYTDAQRDMVSLARSRCHTYLGSSGILSDSFKNEITIADILSSPLVIYEFNKNQNAGASSEVMDAVRLHMCAYLNSRKQSILKSKGNYMISVYEELQRSTSFGKFLEYVAAETTGSRSNNAITLLIMNSLKVLRSEHGADLRSNITSIICSQVEQNDIDTLGEEWGYDWLASQLRLFRDKPGVYRHCFAMNADIGDTQVYQTIYRVELPKYLSEAFTTRTIRE